MVKALVMIAYERAGLACQFRRLKHLSKARELRDNSINGLPCTLQEELVFLKALWDMVATVMRTFAEWCATVWDAIAVDVLVEAAKQLTKDLKTLPKPCRAYDVYRCALARAWLHPCIAQLTTAISPCHTNTFLG